MVRISELGVPHCRLGTLALQRPGICREQDRWRATWDIALQDTADRMKKAVEYIQSVQARVRPQRAHVLVLCRELLLPRSARAMLPLSY